MLSGPEASSSGMQFAGCACNAAAVVVATTVVIAVSDALLLSSAEEGNCSECEARVFDCNPDD